MKTSFFDHSFSLMALLGVIFMAGCSKDSSEESSEDAYYSTGKAYVDEIFNTYYWWYDQVPSGVAWNRDFYEYFDGHMVPQDRWSWMETGDEWRDSQSGTVSGSFGASFAQPIDYYGDYDIYVRYVYINSPMYNAGVRRGWRLDGIGGYQVSDLLRSEEGINTLYEELDKSSNEYVFTSPDTFSHTLNLTASRISTHTYLDSRIFTSDDYPGLTGSVGYFNYWTFVSSMTGEIQSIFSDFKSAGVKDVILDLRYNGGGSTDALSYLVSLIVPKSLDGGIFSVVTHNDLLSELNDVDCYSVSDATLSLKRLFVITGDGTASASEVLINGLRDGLGKANLIMVGDTTYGKPNGMYVFAYPEGSDDDYYSEADYVFLPICFYTCNGAGEQIPDAGFAPSKYEADDLYHDWGVDERRISDCLRYIVNGTFGDTKSSACGNFKPRRAEGCRISVEEDVPGYGRLIARPKPVR